MEKNDLFSSFWVSKKNILNALKMSEGMPIDTHICFYGSSERVNGVTYTKMTIEVGGKKKTFKEKFKSEIL